MKNNWQTKKLYEVCSIDYGTRVVRTRIISGDFDVYGGGGKTFSINEYNRENCTIVSRFAMSKNCVRTVKGKFFLNDSGLSVSTKEKNILFQEFLDKFLLASEDKIYNLGRGQAQRNLYIDAFKEIEIPLPPLKTQKEIVAKLDEKFAKLREVKKLREEAFADTEEILSQTLRQIFEEGKQKGWNELKIIDIANISPAKSEIKDFPDNTAISFIPMSSINEYSQAIEEQEERKLGEVRKGYTYFKRGDIILAKVTPCMENGKIAIADNLKNEIGFGSSEFHVIRTDKKLLNSKYLYQILRQKDFREIAETKMTGTSGLKRVPKEFIENYKILLPSLSEQQEIVTKLDKLSEKIKSLRKLQTSQLADFKRLEKSYLKEAFNGELK